MGNRLVVKSLVIEGASTDADGYLRLVGDGTIEIVKSNQNGTVAPTATDDSSLGYTVGSEWLDTTNLHVYKCLDASLGAAIWVQLSNVA